MNVGMCNIAELIFLSWPLASCIDVSLLFNEIGDVKVKRRGEGNLGWKKVFFTLGWPPQLRSIIWGVTYLQITLVLLVQRENKLVYSTTCFVLDWQQNGILSIWTTLKNSLVFPYFVFQYSYPVRGNGIRKRCLKVRLRLNFVLCGLSMGWRNWWFFGMLRVADFLVIDCITKTVILAFITCI